MPGCFRVAANFALFLLNELKPADLTNRACSCNRDRDRNCDREPEDNLACLFEFVYPAREGVENESWQP